MSQTYPQFIHSRGSTPAASDKQNRAVAEPDRENKVLVHKRRLSANALARLVNDFLADHSVK